MSAPIALFTYARPEHTRRTLETLAANPEAASSKLIVFSDGPKAGAEADVAAVRAIVRERAWCREVELRESPENHGLAASIVSGVSALLSEYDRVIVLEDDLELSPGFLAYMNAALDRYSGDENVMSVSAWLPDLKCDLPETFFLRTTTSWGWATWRRAWERFRPDAAALARELAGREREFNVEGGYDYLRQLRLNAEGKLRTWAVLWYASIFLADGLTLHPRRSLVRNIGHDGTGTHSRPDERFLQDSLARKIEVREIPVAPHPTARTAFRNALRGPFSVRAKERAARIFKRLRRIFK